MPSSHLLAVKEVYKDVMIKAHGREFPFINLLDQHLLRAYCVPGTGLSADTQNKKDMGPMGPYRPQDLSTWEIPTLFHRGKPEAEVRRSDVMRERSKRGSWHPPNPIKTNPSTAKPIIH